MYKNRSRGLKRTSSTLTAGASSSSNLGSNGPGRSSSPSPGPHREPLQEREPSRLGNVPSTPPRKSVESEINSPEPPPSKKPAREVERERVKEPSQKHVKESTSRHTNKPTRDRSSKSSLLNNYVDLDVDVMYMTFPSKFEELVTKSGFKIQGENEPFLLRKDQALFVRNLSILLSDKEDTVEHFIEGFEAFIENNHNFHKMLQETQTDPTFDDARSQMQDSLIRMMLCVDSIQPKVIVILLHKLVELIQRDPREIEKENIPWVELIVKRLCFLDQLVDGTALYNDIFRLMAMAPIAVQQEIIYNLPYMMGDAHHDEVASRLVQLMDANQELTPAVLEALGHLPLSAAQSAQIRTKIMQSIKQAPVEFLPILVKFVCLDDQTHHEEIINGLRSGLPFTKTGEKLLLHGNSLSQRPGPSRPSQAVRQQQKVSCEELASSKAMTFRNLRGAFLSIPSLAVAWLKNIKSIESAREHRPVDIIVLLMMHSKANNRRKQVELTWRNRIKTGRFTDALLEETFQVLLEVLKRHKDDVLNVASMLLRQSDPSVRNYGSAMYNLAFIHFESHMRRQVVSDLVAHVGSGDVHAQTALEVLLSLAETHLDKLSRLTILLQNLLDNIDKLNLLGVRRVMDLLCKMAYAPEVQEAGSVGTLGDNISILVHKQLGSLEPLVKRKGVVSAIMIVKHMAGVSEDMSQSSLENSSLESLPPGRAKDACQLLNLVMRSTRTLPEALGYCFDQLSFMLLRCGNLHQMFLQHLAEQMEEIFMASYLPDDNNSGDSSSLEIQMSTQYGLDESEEPITIGLGALVLKEGRNTTREGGGLVSIESTYPLLVLTPLFRLFRVLKLRNGDQDLEDIDALLGCAISMPSHDTIVDFNSFGPSQQGVILDCLFYCINWFREVINAFVNCKPDNYQQKVMIRLRNVVGLQGTLSRLLSSSLHYIPPLCMFYDKPRKLNFKVASEKRKEKKKGKGKGKNKKNSKKKVNESASVEDSTVDDPEEEDDNDNEDDKDKDEEQTGPTDLSQYRDFFREIDMDVFGIMKNELVMTPRPEKGSGTTPDFGPAELRFLLEDYVAKLNHSLPSGATNRFTAKAAAAGGSGSFALWDLLPVTEIAANAISLLPVLCEKLEQLGESCRNLLVANDGLIDGPGMFVEGTVNLKICFALILKAMSLTFSWNGFQSVHHADLLTQGLKVLATRLDGSIGRRSSILALVEEAASYLKRFHEWTLHLDAAVHLVKLLKVLGALWDLDATRSATRLNHTNPTKSILKDVCKDFLSRPWSTLGGTSEKGLAYTAQVDLLVCVYMDSVEDAVGFLDGLVPKICDEAKELNNKDSALDTFPAISKSIFYILYRAIYVALLKDTQAELRKDDSSAHQIKVWTTVFKILETLADVTKEYSGRSYLGAVLKHGQTLLKMFVDKGLPVLEWALRGEPDKVMAIVKSSQVFTRFINKVCLTCKTNRYAALSARVPNIRATMETLVYRVKGMLALNNIESAWNMGTLKNRDIHNVELCTQESNEDDEAELPEAEEDADITALDSDIESEADSSRNTSRKNKSNARKRRSNSGSEDEESEENDEDDGDNTSVSTAY